MQPLAEADIVIDTIVQSGSIDGVTSITFSLPDSDLEKAQNALKDAGFDQSIVDKDVAKVSAVGIGMKSQTGVAATFFNALANANINIKVVSTSDIKISVLIAREQVQQAVQALHSAYRLDKS
jgi:aspartate kinase